MFGRILESVSNNKYTVSYVDGQIREMSSRQLKKASEADVILYHQAISELIDTNENDNDSKDDISIVEDLEYSNNPFNSSSFENVQDVLHPLPSTINKPSSSINPTSINSLNHNKKKRPSNTHRDTLIPKRQKKNIGTFKKLCT